MVSANDVAAYILQKQGPVSAMKLHKLLYYCQAWALVWDDEPMFEERIEAWANGPVVREVFDQHRGMFKIEQWPNGDAGKLPEHFQETADIVLREYGPMDAQWLSDLTHQEDPWRKARGDMPITERGNSEITWASMSEYYSSLPADSE